LSSYGKTIFYPGFFTTTIRGWKHLLKPEKYKNIVLNNLKELVKEKKIYLYAFCIMNSHIHLIWQVRGERDSSEVQKTLLENISK
jgi:REP element-mobilizing transposase RayT